MTTINIIDAEVRGDAFKFEIDDVPFEFPHANTIDPVIWAEFAKQEATIKRYFWLIRNITTERNADAVLKLCPIGEIESLLESWTKHAGVGLGKVSQVYLLVEAHTRAIEGDLRARFNIKGVNEFLYQLTLREKISLIEELLNDVSSRLVASQEGMDYSWSLEAKILSDLYDLQHKKAAGKKKIKAYPRPYRSEAEKTSFAKKKPANNLNSFEILQKYRQGQKR